MNTLPLRRQCDRIAVGKIHVGGNSPITVQSMTNTLTHDVDATIAQIHALEKVGADIVRVSCPEIEDTQALPEIQRAIGVPLVADIHFHYQRAIEAIEAGVACLRINPGNMHIKRRESILSALKAHDCSLRIGINGGSLEKGFIQQEGSLAKAMVASAEKSALWFYERDFSRFKVSLKASDPMITVEAYRIFAKNKQMTCPLHLGVTEAGSGNNGIVRSSVAMGILLAEGIGDTIRISLSDDPRLEIKTAFNLLGALHLRKRGINIVACPSCARQGFDVITMVKQLEDRVCHIEVPVQVSLMGCVVNGPGEAKHADIGFTGGSGCGILHIKNQKPQRINHDDIIERMVEEIEKIAQEKKHRLVHTLS